MPECPICFLNLKLDEAEFAAHVNYHFEHEGDERPFFEDDFGRAEGGSSDVGYGSASAPDRVDSGMGLVRSVGGYADIDQGHGRNFRSSSRDIENSSSPPSCFICGTDLSHLLSETARQSHANACLDRAGFADNAADATGEGDHLYDERFDPFVSNDFTVAARGGDRGEKPSSGSGSHHTTSSTLRSKGDPWWNPVLSPLASLPPNYSPSLIPIIHQILLLSHSQSPQVTKSAILSHPSTCHVKATWGFDIGWGCGYRNFLMGLTTVLCAREEYRCAFGLGKGKKDGTMEPDAPGVRNLQLWMAQGWNEGYDPTGREQFKNQIIGTKKWIGTSDMYVVFTRKGIPCQLYDFPKATGGKWHSASNTHAALVRWVVAYFDEEESSDPAEKKVGRSDGQPASAFDIMMQNGKKPAGSRDIRISTKMPLILQHAGHSRTIIGYEINAQGSINLLMFDPNGGISAEIRQSGIAYLEKEQREAAAAGPSSLKGVPQPVSKRGRTIESTQQAAMFVDPADWSDEETASSTTARQAMTGQKRRSESPQDEMVTKKRKSEGQPAAPANGVKKWLGNGTSGKDHICDWERKPVKALGTFRVNLSSLSRNSAYQILAFTGGPLLSETEKRSKRIVTSIQILD